VAYIPGNLPHQESGGVIVLTVRVRLCRAVASLGFGAAAAAAGVLAAGVVADLSPLWAALPQVANLRVQGSSLTWNSLPGTAGYNVYRGDVAGLRAGNYGACLLGSVQGLSAGVPNDPVPVGTAVFFLVDGFDESGEGQVADPPGASPSVRCTPARRNFALTPDGDPGDGITDGTEPLRNPDGMYYFFRHNESGHVLLQSGEFVLSARDLDTVGRSPHGVSVVHDSGSGLGEGKRSFDEIDFGKHDHKLRLRPAHPPDLPVLVAADPEWPAILEHCSDGVHFKKCKITVRHADPPGGGGGGGANGVCAPDDPLGYEGASHVSGSWPGGAGMSGAGTGGAGTGGAGSLSDAYQVARSYRSQVKYSGPLGRGWDFPANARLQPSGSSALYFDGTGRQELFVRLDAIHFAPTRGRYALLFQNADGSFTLRDRDGSMQNLHGFDGSNRQGVLESALDRQGDRASFLYDSQGLLTDVVDPLGRTIHYGYDPQGRVTSITDFAGRQVVYGYDAGGNLTSVRSPIVTGTPNGNDFPSGRTTQYSYTSGFADDRQNGNLILVMRPNEAGSMVPAVQNVYGTDAVAFNLDRIVSQTIGGTNASGVAAGGTLTYAYQSLNPGGDPSNLALPRRKATVLDRNGNQKEFVHNANGNCLSLVERTNRNLRAGEADYTTQYSYNSDGELILVLRPQGDKTQYFFDTSGADHYRAGNLIFKQNVADDHLGGGRGDGHGGESSIRTWTFTYEPVFNQIASFTDPRGNDPAYVPQNGGANTPGRYTRTWMYDYQEADPATNGINAYAGRFAISLAGGTFALGDLNGDGGTAQAAGNPVKISDPGVHLDPASMQAAIAGGPLQIIETKLQWNAHGQPTAVVDAEQNRDEYQYFPETDPDGDGTPTPAPADGRVLDAATGGFLKTAIVDTLPAPGRDNGANPVPVQIQYDMTYDPMGNLAALVDGRGVETRSIHNALGELVEVREAAATADASGPDGTPPTGRGETGLAAFGFLTRCAYDADGDVVALQREDRGGTRGVGSFVTTTLTRDILGDLVQVDQPATSTQTLTTRYVYDANQNLTRLTEPDQNSHDQAYDERDLLLSSTRGSAGPLGGASSTRRYDYDGDGNLSRLTDGRNGVTDFQYDGHNRLARSIDPVGGSLDRFYDPASAVVRLLARGTVGGPTPPDRSGSSNVDLSDQRLLYDELNRRIRTDTLLFVPAGAAPGRPPMITEGSLLPADGAVNTGYEYDRLSRPTFVHRDSGAVTRLDYDGAGRTLKSTDAAGDTIEWTWDAASDAIESVETELSSIPGPTQEQFLTTVFYDALGRRSMAVDNLGQTTRTLYDTLGAQVTASDANGPPGGSVNRRSPGHTGMAVPVNGHGNVTRFTYDAAGRPLGTTQVLTATGKGDGTTTPPPDTSNTSNPDGLMTSTRVWSSDGLLLQALDDKGNTTSYAYDNLDRRVRTTRADNTFTLVGYDGEDAVTGGVDPNGSHVTNFIDLAGRTVQRQIEIGLGVQGTTHQSFEYDGLSRTTRAIDPNTGIDQTDDTSIAFTYDSLGRLVEEAQQPAGASGGAARYSDLAWEAESLLTGLTYPDGDQVLYGYDGAERLRTMNDMMHPELMAAFEYFGLDRLLTRQYGNGVRLTFLDDAGATDVGYDGARRPVLMRHVDSSNALLAGFEYRYDRNGRPTSVRRLHDSSAAIGGARGNLYGYDSTGRLTSAQTRYLDANHNPVSTPSDQEAWTLDGPGNWASLTRNGTLYLDTPNNLNEYDEPQCCGTHTEDGIADDFLDVAGTPIPDGLNLTYDRNGNQTNTPRQTLSYNFANLPVAARDLTLGAPVAAYSYDALGRRTKRVVTGGEGTQGTRTEAYAGGVFAEAIEEDDPTSGPAMQYGVGPGGGCLWHVRGDGSTQYLLEDALGSTVALTPAFSAGGGGVLERVVYDPHGKPTFEDPFNNPITAPGGGPFIAESQYDNHHLFRGMHYDPELGTRTTNVNTDFGGLYSGERTFNPNEGRGMNARAANLAGNYSGNDAGGYSGNYAGNYSGNLPGNYSGNESGHDPGNIGLDAGTGRLAASTLTDPQSEIFVDKFGRIKVQFHWDRDGKKDEDSSSWIRVGRISGRKKSGGDSQPSGAPFLVYKFGTVFTTKIGWESSDDPCPPSCSRSSSLVGSGEPSNDPHDVNE
jgi:YD repeat-containing protein